MSDAVRKTIEKTPRVSSATFDFETKHAVVLFDPVKIGLEVSIKATADAGHPSTVKGNDERVVWRSTIACAAYGYAKVNATTANGSMSASIARLSSGQMWRLLRVLLHGTPKGPSNAVSKVLLLFEIKPVETRTGRFATHFLNCSLARRQALRSANLAIG